jgi:drug/metabolite transporter (DMT)-like permease
MIPALLGLASALGLGVADFMGMARGPIAVVAPIVAAHPVLVLAVNVSMGVRPSAVQWAAMASIVAGGIIIARGAVEESDGPQGESNWPSIWIASGACLAYAALVLTGQAAAPMIGEFQTMWIGRWSGLAFIAVMLAWQRQSVRIPASWLPYVGLQGLLDTAGYFTFLAGANTVAPHITMVVASAFSVVTVLLARVVIHEPVSKTQWGAIALIAAGTAALSAT